MLPIMPLKSQYWKYFGKLTFAENWKIFETGELQQDLNEFSDWAKDNQLKLNPSKCQALCFLIKNGATLHADVMIGTEKLPYVNKAKVLGFWLQCDLKWASQVDCITKKLTKCCSC